MNKSISLTLFSALFVCFFFSCKTNTPITYEKSKLYFGSGGGFTGAVSEYCLLSNGEFFKKKAQSEDFIVLPKIKKSTAKALFEEMETLKIQELDHDQPGNMYHFLTYAVAKKTHRVAWASSESPFNTEQAAFYEKLMKLIPSATQGADQKDILE